MKIAVVFLVAVSSFSGLIHSVGGISQIHCEFKGSQDSKKHVVDLGVTVSMLENRKPRKQEDVTLYNYYKDLLTEIKGFLGKLCLSDSIVQRHLDTVDATDPKPDMASNLVGTLKPVLEKAGLRKSAYNAIYNATKDVRNPKCFPLLFGGGFRKLVTDVKTKLYQASSPNLSTDDLTSIVRRCSCLLDDGPWEDSEISKVVNNMAQDKFSRRNILISRVIAKVFLVGEHLGISFEISSNP